MKQSGNSWLSTFPFWLIIDKTNPPKTKTIYLSKKKYIFYPPFRSGNANFIPMPFINIDKIPIKKGSTKPKTDPSMVDKISAIPVLNFQNRTSTINLIRSNEFTDYPKNQFPMDSIRIDFSNDITGGGTQNHNIIYKFLEHLRVESNQWWITRSSDGLLGYTRNCFPINKKGGPTHYIQGTVSMIAAYGEERPIDSQIWDKSLTNFQNGNNANISQIRILDFLYYLSINDFRNSILNATMALEIEAELTFERLWYKNNSIKFKRGRVMKGDNLPNHISNDIDILIKKSYQKEYPVNFSKINNLWLARGNVAHGGNPEYINNGNKIIFDSKSLLDLKESLLHCLNWLRNI